MYSLLVKLNFHARLNQLTNLCSMYRQDCNKLYRNDIVKYCRAQQLDWRYCGISVLGTDLTWTEDIA